ncbi:MAG: tail fiber domain-containing protein [Planctomycetes bacterium]|nr:tail fiber domain-containing protein [Planctomycetota bacterium]
MPALHRLQAAALGAALLLVTTALPASGQTAPPNLIHVEGRLTNSAGVPVNSAVIDIRIQFYDDLTVGAPDVLLGTYTAQDASITNGIYALQVTPPAGAFGTNAGVYLQIGIGNGVGGADAIFEDMTPRTRMLSAAYALNADLLDGRDSTYFAVAPGSGTYVQLAPTAAQTWTANNVGIFLNETGASAPFLLQLQQGGSDMLVLGNSGNMSLTGDMQVMGNDIQDSSGNSRLNLGATVTTPGGTGFSVTGNTTLGDAATDGVTVSGEILGASPLAFEGLTNNDVRTTFAFTDPSVARTITFPDATGTVLLTSTSSGNYVSSITGGTGVDPDGANTGAVTLSTDMTELSLTGLTGGATSLSVNYGTAANTAVQGNQTGTGVAVAADTVGLDYSATLAGSPALAAGQSVHASTGILFEGSTVDANEGLLTVADPSADWTWTLPTGGGTLSAGTGTANYNAYWSGTNTIAAEQYTAVSRGGTGLGSTATNGQILIGNGAGYTLAALSEATAYEVAVTNAAGSITLGYDYSATQTGDLGLASNRLVFGSTGLIFEGASANPFEGALVAADISGDRTWTLPDVSGTLLTSGTVFVQDGNAFGTTATLGTNDAFTLAFETSGASRATIDSSGNVNVDSNTLYVDAANNRVGLGTAGPVERLDVAGTINVNANGASEDPVGTAAIAATSGGVGGSWSADGTISALAANTTLYAYYGWTLPGSACGGYILSHDGTGDAINVADGGVTTFVVRDGGNVGLGTGAPGTSFTVRDANAALLTSIQQNISSNSVQIESIYGAGSVYWPGLMWSTSDNNATKPKAGIWSYGDGSGSRLYLGTSNNYATGITNSALTIDPSGNVSISGTLTVGGSGPYVLKTGDTMTGTLNVSPSGATSYGVNVSGGTAPTYGLYASGGFSNSAVYGNQTGASTTYGILGYGGALPLHPSGWSWAGVYGYTNNNLDAMYGHVAGGGGSAVFGVAAAANTGYGVRGYHYSATGTGVRGDGQYGVYGSSLVAGGSGVYGNQGSGSYAGYFNGPLYVSGTGTATSDFRAPVFYDSNNTSYFLDANAAGAAVNANTNGLVLNGQMENLSTWGMNARAQGMVIMPEGSVTDNGAGTITFGSTVIVMNPASGSWIRVSAGAYALGAWGYLWVNMPPTNARGGTYAPTVSAWADADVAYAGRDRVILAQRMAGGEIYTRFATPARSSTTSDIDGRYVNVAGDTMTGALTMGSNAVNFNGSQAIYNGDGTYLYARSNGAGSTGIRLMNSASSSYGYLYADGTNIGLLSNGGSWLAYTNQSGDFNTVGDLTVSGNDITGTGDLILKGAGGGYVETKSNSATYGLIVRDSDSTDWVNVSANNASTPSNGFVGYLSTTAGLRFDSSGNLGLGAAPSTSYRAYSYRPANDYGSDRTCVYGYRYGYAGAPANGGSSWSPAGVDSAVKGYSYYGNQYTAGVAGYNYGDYTLCAGVIGGDSGGTTWGALAYKDAGSTWYAGYFNGTVNATNNIINSGPINGTLGLSGDLSGYATNTYPTLKSSGNYIYFDAGGTYTGYIGYNTGFIDVSDGALKKDVKRIGGALDKLLEINGVTFTWADGRDKGEEHMGVIAQEVEKVAPQLVSQPPGIRTKGVFYGGLNALTIEAIRELRTEIERLDARVTALEGRK